MTRRIRLEDEELEEYEKDVPFLPSLTVYEPEESEKTGLLDADGNPIVRARNPIGFLADL